MLNIIESIENSNLTSKAKRQLMVPIKGLDEYGTLIRNGLFEQCIYPNLLNEEYYIYLFLHRSHTAYDPRVSFELLQALKEDKLAQCHPTLFGNPLAIPEGFGTEGYDPFTASSPTDRITNAGFFFNTVEWDHADLDEQLKICVGKGKGLDKDSPLGLVDRHLQQYRDYRGMTAVFSGHKSVHVHFVFNLREMAAELAELGLDGDPAHWVRELHRTAWDDVIELVQVHFPHLGAPDIALSRYTQSRRLPYGIRRLGADNQLGLTEGSEIMQVPLLDLIRTKKANGADKRFLKRPDPSKPRRKASSPSAAATGITYSTEDLEDAFFVIADRLHKEWGEWPKPAQLDVQNGEVRLLLYNGPDDRTPSSVIRGDNRRVLFQGKSAPEGEYFLPDGMTLMELVNTASSIR